MQVKAALKQEVVPDGLEFLRTHFIAFTPSTPDYDDILVLMYIRE